MGPSDGFLCVRWTFCQLPATFRVVAVVSVNFPCVRRTFRQLFVRLRLFRQLSVRPQDLPSTFFASTQPPATSINFPCVRWTFRELFYGSRAFHQISVSPRDLPSTSVNFLCVVSTFHELPSTFCALAVPSINFCQLFVHPRDLL